MFTLKVTRKLLENGKMIITLEPPDPTDTTLSGSIIFTVDINTTGIFLDNLYDVQPHVEVEQPAE
jgi:hypothetical protein